MFPTTWRGLDTRHWRVPAKENIRDKHDIHNFFFVNDTQREKLCFIQISTRMDGWLLLAFFICLHSQLSSITCSLIR